MDLYVANWFEGDFVGVFFPSFFNSCFYYASLLMSLLSNISIRGLQTIKKTLMKSAIYHVT